MKIPLAAVESTIKQYYGLDVRAQPLNGYEEQNFLILTDTEEKYIFKAADLSFNINLLRAQTAVLQHLSCTPLKHNFPASLSGINGESIIKIEIAGQTFFIRLLTFLEGDFWVDQQPKTQAMYESLGHLLGLMDRQLEGLYFDALDRSYVWDNNTAQNAEKKLHFIKDPEKRRIADYFLLQFQTEVLPHLSELRQAVIHGDANDYNVLVRDGKVSGVIDFGDLIWSSLINNTAIACTYAMLNTTDPITAAAGIIKGYHAVYPYTELEMDLLYYLIAARLCISVTQSAEQSALNSDNTHHFLTENYAWTLLDQLLRINPLYAANAFRAACGMETIIPPQSNHESLIAQRKQHIGANLSISYTHPLKIEKGALQYLYDDLGKTYIDCVNNVSHVGHCHPRLVRAMQHQIAMLNTNTRYLNDAIVAYAEKLLAKLPPNLSVCYFVNSGSEANDLAIRMARNYTGHHDIIVLDHAYHGTSTLAIEMSPYKFDGKGGSGPRDFIHKAISPNLYRGPYRKDDPKAGQKYAHDVKLITEKLNSSGRKPAAFICETLLGVGGQIPLPDGYLKDVYQFVRQSGGVCIADEVQVGFGRVGETFWGFELQEVQPDIVVMGKPIGNGHPLAAVAVTAEIARSFDNGMEYFNTFGGNPVSMITGSTVLKIIDEENLQQHALTTGTHFLEELKKLMGKYPIIGDVRGHGLFIGIELVKDRHSQRPAVPEINYIVEEMKERGFLLSTDGPLHNVIKIKPPMVFSKQNADDLVRVLDEVLSKTEIISE